MKKLILLFLAFGLLTACSHDDNRIDNPNLLDINVNFTIDTSLPQYNPLNFPNNPVYVSQYGNAGIILINTGVGYLAWDAADPNHPRNGDCVAMEIDGIYAVCDCEENKYELPTGNFSEGSGGENLKYTLYGYRVTENSNGLLRVTNF